MQHRNKYYVVYKPYGMVSQFSKLNARNSLSDLYRFPGDVYPVGRLDADSEGLLILTNDKKLNHMLLAPGFSRARTYLAQVEGNIKPADAKQLEKGVAITIRGKRYQTAPCKARPVNVPPGVPERIPPIRFRKTVPDSWVEIVLYEGKNRQVRKMTAAVGFPTLRLIRWKIELLSLKGMLPGAVVEYKQPELFTLLKLMHDM